MEFKKKLSLLTLFEKHFSAQYTALIKESETLIPKIIDRIFVEKRQAFVPTDKLAPKTTKILKTIPSNEMCECFIGALLLQDNPDNPDMLSGTVNMILKKAIKQLTFLVDIFQLEIFLGTIRSESDDTQVFGAAYSDFVEVFVSKP